MWSEIEVSYLYHLLEEIITRHEETLIDDDCDRKELKEKRIETLYDSFCWNMKLIDTEKFMMENKKPEKYAYSTRIIISEEKISELIRISLGMKKPKDLFNRLIPKFDLFNEKRKRKYYEGEDFLTQMILLKGTQLFAMIPRKEPV
jgi:hypothetical protein